MNISLPILLLIFGSLSFWLMTESSLKWYIKTACISTFCIFTVIFWSTINSFLGWPADENDVPEENRWCVAPPQFWTQIRLAKTDAAGTPAILDASSTGNQSALMNGRITDRKIHGFDLYQSNTMVVGSAGTAAAATFGPSSTSGEMYVLFGHMSAVATASHIAKTEVIRDPDSFSDIVRGLHVFGRKVLRGESTTGFKGVFKGLMDLNS